MFFKTRRQVTWKSSSWCSRFILHDALILYVVLMHGGSSKDAKKLFNLRCIGTTSAGTSTSQPLYVVYFQNWFIETTAKILMLLDHASSIIYLIFL